MIPISWRVYRSPSGDGKEARRRVWRIVGIGVGLLRHDGEVEGVVVKDDAVLELCVRGRAAHAMLRRMSQNDEVTIVFQVYFSAGCCDMRKKASHSSQADITMGEKIV